MDLQVRNAEDRSRYELLSGEDVIGIADYRVVGDSVAFPHTEIDAARRGQGLGDVLVAGALDDVRAAGRTAVPQCWFVADFIERHPAYADLVP
jgi:predicted GNAT family acetyltransferase